MVEPEAIRARHRRHRADPQRGLHRRQPFDAGQRHRDPPCRGAGARAADRRGGGALAVAGRDAAARTTGRSTADDGRRAGYGELVGRRAAACPRRAGIAAVPSRRSTGRSASRCRASTSRPRSPAARPMCRTCGCRTWCTPASCARRATAPRCARSTPRRVEQMPGVRQGRARRQLSRRRRRARIPGDRGDARAGRGRAMGRDARSLPEPGGAVR